VMQMTGRLKWEEKFATAPQNQGPIYPAPTPLR